MSYRIEKDTIGEIKVPSDKYNSIMQFDKFNILKNISAFYKESEQMETYFIENESTILMIQPLPFFDEVQYDLLKEELSNDQNHWLEEYLIDTNEISVLKQ